MSTIQSRITSIVGTYALSTEAERLNGRQWYDQAHMAALEMSAQHPTGIITTAGVIAALSPNNRWDRNLLDADHMIGTYYRSGGYDAGRCKVATYGAMRAKALAILKLDGPTVEDVAAILNGRKITAFYRCILGDGQSVCVDGHAYSVWYGEPIPTTRTPDIGKRLYERISSDYRLAAAMIGEGLTPRQLQAITWLTHRRLHGRTR